jgi:hypothetical protein
MPMIQLVYCSQATAPFSTDALRALLVKARATNTPLAVTGCLLHIEGSFLQTLEGEAAAVNDLFARIGGDKRHRKVISLVVREIDAAQFPDWSMGFIDASKRAASLPGYRAQVGFADLAGDATRLHQIIDGFRDGRWRN